MGERFKPVAPTRTQEEIDAEKWEETKRDRWTEWQSLVSVLGKRFENCTLDNFEIREETQKQAIKALCEFAVDMKKETRVGWGIFLFGPAGRGKDHLMVAMIRHAVLNCGYPVTWKNGLDLFGDFRDLMNSDKREADVISDYVRPEILAISDPIPPSGQLTDYQATMLQRIVDARYRQLKPVWVTCNAEGQTDAEKKLGVPVVGRLSDNALVIKTSWSNYRKPREVLK